MKIVNRIYNSSTHCTDTTINIVYWDEMKKAITKAYNKHLPNMIEQFWRSWEVKNTLSEVNMNEILEDLDDALRYVVPDIIIDTQCFIQEIDDESNKEG